MVTQGIVPGAANRGAMPSFKPPADWDAVYASAEGYFFGEEPSQLARTALHFYRMFGGPADGLALDLGSGEGRDTASLAAAGLRVVARDLAPTGLEKTRALLARKGVASERVDLALGDVRDFAYPRAAYDLTLAANVYQFLPPADAPGHIARLQAATKPGGVCAVGVFSPAMRGWGAEVGDHFCATADELLALFPRDGGWLPLDRTEYWTYRPKEGLMMSFSHVVARRQAPE
jgi:SAM-dependent methyltransferase